MLLPRRTTAQFLVAILLLSTLSPASAFADTAFSLHAVRYNLTYVAGQLASFFSDLADSIASHIPVTSLTASAAAPIPSPIAPPAPALDFLATTTPEVSTPPTTPTASDTPTTIIQQPVIERIVERTVPAPAASGISEQTLAGRIASLKDDLLLRIAAVASAPIAFSGPAPTTPVSTATFATSQRIDQLTNTTINTPTITGGTISGATVSGTLSGTFSGTISGATSFTEATTTSFAISSIPWGLLSTDGLGNIVATSTPTALNFIATSATATSTFAGGLTGPGNFVVQQGSGNVGVGTTSPSVPLHIVRDAVEARIDLDEYAPSASGPIILGKKARGTLASPSAALTNDTLLAIAGRGYGSTAFPGSSRVAMTFAAAETWTDSAQGTYVKFETTPLGSVSRAERLRIDNNGNVGIGTTSPTNKLEVAGNAFLGGTITGTSTLALTGTTGTTTIALGQGFTIGGSQFVVQQGSGNVGIGTAIPVDKLSILKSVGNDTPAAGVILSRYQASASDMRAAGIFNYFDSSAGKEVLAFSLSQATTPNTIANTKMVIRHDGNVGIGTTSPFRKFEVAGSSGESSGGPIMALYATNGFTNARRFSIQNGVDATSNYLGFNVENDAGAVASTPLTIRTSGNVGIGTTTPDAKLVVGGSGQSTADLNTSANLGASLVLSDTNVAGAVGSGGSLIFGGTGSAGNLGRFAAIKGLLNNSGTNSTGDLAFSTRNAIADATLTERLRITYTGNVGIGTTTPWGKLSVTGSGTGTGLAFAVADSANTPRFVIQDNGNVGIGTTSPSYKLDVAGNAFFGGTITGTSTLALTGTTGTSTIALGQGFTIGSSQFVVQQGSGNVGIGTMSPAATLDVAGSILMSGGNQNFTINRSSNTQQGRVIFQTSGTNKYIIGLLGGGFGTSGSDKFVITNEGGGTELFTISGSNVGIGTTTPTAQLSTTGTVRFAGLGSAGANLVTDALGNVTASSDERLKDKQGDFTRGLDAINAISPVLYKWRPETGFDTQSTYAGFFAQNVQTAIPEAVSPDSRGYLTLADRPILAAVVNAIKELAQQVGNLAERVVTKEIVATNGSFRRVNTGELCVDDICVTREQFAAMVAAAGQSAGSPSPTPSGTLQAPVIELNGNATSTIEISDSYNDLGARIVAPESDLNLGIVIVLDGATTTSVSIDTTTPGEHTILYTVTSPTTGLTGNITRTVIIAPAEQSPEPPANDNPFNAPDNDNASSTTAVDAAA